MEMQSSQLLCNSEYKFLEVSVLYNPETYLWCKYRTNGNDIPFLISKHSISSSNPHNMKSLLNK